MKLFAISSLVALALVTGCAASAGDEAADSSQDELTSRPRIDLGSSHDAASLQAKLYNLMDAFKGDPDLGVDVQQAIESASLKIAGAHEAGVSNRAVTCNAMAFEAVAPGGGGFTHVTMYDCSLEGFDKVRNGGKLPSVVVPFEGNKPLAGKLFALLAAGEKKGELGVKRIGGAEPPPCCDFPTTLTYAIADDSATLSCTNVAGGFAPMNRIECVFTKNDAHN